MGVFFAAVVLLAATAVRGEDVPTLGSCEISAAAVEPSEFVLRALGGDRSCATAADKSGCCKQIEGVFSKGGAAELCLCNKEFFSAVVAGLTLNNGVSSDDYVHMLVECGIPVAGRSSCPGVAEDGVVEPVVQSQLIISSILSQVLGKGATPKAPKPAAPKPSAPKPPAPRPPVQPAVIGGKKGAPVKTIVPSKKVVTVATPQFVAPTFMVATPTAPSRVVPAPAPVAFPAPAPVAFPAPAPVAAPAPAPVAAPAPAPVVAPPAFSGSLIGGSN